MNRLLNSVERAAQIEFIAKTLDDALRYIQHVGANHVMRGQPHPQQWLVENLQSAIKVIRLIDTKERA